jgi:PKD repeat protein
MKRKSLLNKIYCLSLFILPILFSTGVLAQQPPNFTNDLVSTGWDEIEGFVWDSTGQQYAWEKKGVVWVIDTNGVKITTPLIDLQHEVGNWRDHGLNGFALDPNFRVNGYFYLFYTVDRYHLLNAGSASYDSTANLYFNATIARVTRYKASSATNFRTVVPNSRLVLIGETKKTGIPVVFESHSAGTLLFAPDGSLIVTAGDGAYYNAVDSGNFQYSYYAQALADSIIKPKENVGAFRSQLVDCMNGKIMRIDPATGNGIASNPFYDPAFPRAPRSRVYALGLRNPYRVTLRPGTGSTDITAGFPGVFYIGDVGWDTWEDFNICDEPGQNFGWPLFEGLQAQPGYMAQVTENLDAPNPLFGVNGCTLHYFRFRDLIKQVTLTPNYNFPNPCNANVNIPSSIPTFIHVRPVIDYHHGYFTGIARTGIFVGQTASEIALNDPASPLQGDTFPGFASIAGVWYNDTRFPPAYQNTYFHADFVGGWIKNLNIDSNNVASKINNFAQNTGYIDFLTVNPRDGCINYARYPNEIREICYTASINNPPVAKITVNAYYGASPLTIQFNGSQSSDPENQPLTYFWQFRDGGTSSAVNPSHTYNVAGNIPTSYYAKLTVTDNVGQTATDSILISVNNTPPVVQITSFDDGDLYSMNSNSSLPLTASVTDAQHGPGQLYYEWTTYLHHNSHVHIEATDTNKISSTVISPLGCVTGVTYYFEVQLKVTDAAGLSTTVSNNIYPACDPPVAKFIALDNIICKGDTMKFIDKSTNFPNQWQWSFPGGIPSSSTLQNPVVVYPTPGNYNVTLVATSVRGTNTIVKTGYAKIKGFPNVTVSSSTGSYSFCTGVPYSLIANSTSSIASYEWKRAGVTTGTNNDTLAVTQGGSFKVFVTDIYGCSKGSVPVSVTKLPAPSAVNVSASGPLIFCPPATVTLSVTNPQVTNTYQWKKYGNPISGATATQYTVTATGQYKVVATNQYNCSTPSSPFSIIASCRIGEEQENLTVASNSVIYPNPADQIVNLDFQMTESAAVTIMLYDLTGRKTTIVSDEMFEKGDQHISFDISAFAPGMYQLRITSGNNQETLKLIKSGQ